MAEDRDPHTEDRHWTLQNPIERSKQEQRKIAVDRDSIDGTPYCRVGHEVESVHAHHMFKVSQWVNEKVSHFPSNFVSLCSVPHHRGALGWEDVRPHFQMWVFGQGFDIHSRFGDPYTSWEKTMRAVLGRDEECRCCGVDNRQFGAKVPQTECFVQGNYLRPYHVANPHEEPAIAHVTSQMVTLCFKCFLYGCETGPSDGWRRESPRMWRKRFLHGVES